MAPDGAALLFSVVLRPPLPVARWPEIPLATGCAVAEAVETLAPVSATLKWPNDVLVGERKLAGILAEGVAGVPPLVIVGIGVNVSQQEPDWPPGLAGTAASLAGLGAEVARETALAAMLASLARWYGVLLEEGFEPVRAAWRRRGVLGRRVSVPGGEGTTDDLGPGGELVVRQDDGQLTYLVVPPDGHRQGAAAGMR